MRSNSIVYFGIGKNYASVSKELSANTVVALIDNDANKQGKSVDGYVIQSPENIRSIEFDYIIITVKKKEEIFQQILSYGINSKKILDLSNYEFLKNVNRIITYHHATKTITNNGKKILMLAHSVGYTGASVALFKAIEIFLRKGYQIHVFSLDEMNLKSEILKLGIPFSIAEQCDFAVHDIKHLIQWADFVFVNTLVFHPYISEIHKINDNVIWWLHEDEWYYKILGVRIKEVFLNGIQVLGVGERAINSFKKYYHSNAIEELLYGIEDMNYDSKELNHREKMVFAMIGYCDERKGIDVMYGAIAAESKRANETEFWIAGSDDEEIKRRFDIFPNVCWKGTMPHDSIINLMKNIDVLITPSRSDPMPIVVTEGMMMKKMCIVSDAVGQMSIIKDGVNGLIFKSEDINDLAKKIEWSIDNKEKVYQIGEAGYDIYKEKFSMEIFESNLLRVVDSVTK